MVAKQEEKINYGWLFVTIAVAVAIGIIAASLMEGDFRVSLLAEYAGSDLLEGLFKLKFTEKFKRKK